MKISSFVAGFGAAVALVMTGAANEASAAAAAAGGTIKGHVRLTGKLPGNPIIRMGMDPMCSKINAGQRVIQETVMASLDGSLANVFVQLQGTFPSTPVPTEPVVIDQQGCVYRPRVMGVRVGQTIQLKNSDALLHNVHAMSTGANTFDFGQAKAGVINEFKAKAPEMLELKCQIHSWMHAYVGIVTHPYFAVTHDAGTFQITGVPPGSYKIQAWQEHYGPSTQDVRVRAGATTTIEFTYASTEKPASTIH